MPTYLEDTELQDLAELSGTFTIDVPDKTILFGDDGKADTDFVLPSSRPWLLIEVYDVDGITGNIGYNEYTDNVSDISGRMTSARATALSRYTSFNISVTHYKGNNLIDVYTGSHLSTLYLTDSDVSFVPPATSWLIDKDAGITIPTPYTVVPNVYGFGTDTRASYGGGVDPVILHVDTLASGISNTDSTHGTFEWCVSRPYPRIVVFDVSGVIQTDTVNNRFVQIDQPYLSIYGQTAPDNICIQGSITIVTHDVLIQHLAIRNQQYVDKSGFTVSTLTCTSYQGPNYNIVVDHCSASWSTDEGFGAWTYAPDNVGVHDVTFSNCIHGYGIFNHATSVISSIERLSVIGNLHGNNNHRHPFVKEGSHTAYFNNLTYNWGYRIAQVSGDYDYNAPCKLDFRGNVTKAGPYTISRGNTNCKLVQIFADYAGKELQLYMTDNNHNGTLINGFDVENNPSLTNYEMAGTPLTLPEGCEPYSSSLTYDRVLANAGARPAYRDSVDSQLISEVQSGTGGGELTVIPPMPSYTETTTAFVPVANPHSMYDSNYTNLEHQMHLLAEAVEN